MGVSICSSCKAITKDRSEMHFEEELKNRTFFKFDDEKIKNDPKLMHKLKKIQRNIRKYLSKKKQKNSEVFLIR